MMMKRPTSAVPFPLSIKVGMTFDSIDQIFERLAKEGVCSGFPRSLYQTNTAADSDLQLMCVLCDSKLSFVKQNGRWLTEDVDPYHFHSSAKTTIRVRHLKHL